MEIKNKQKQINRTRREKENPSINSASNIQMWNIFCTKFKIPTTLPRSTSDGLS